MRTWKFNIASVPIENKPKPKFTTTPKKKVAGVAEEAPKKKPRAKQEDTFEK